MEISFKNQCIALRKEGRSIIEIMHATGRPKTSIYFHIQNLPLSLERWRQIRTTSGNHIRRYAIARKGKSSRSFKEFSSWTPDTVLLVAHLSFDGEIIKSRCAYNNRSEALISRVEKLMTQVYDYVPKKYPNAITGVTRIYYFNVALGNYLKRKSEDLLQNIVAHTKANKREFLRAFFDDEGCMDFRLGGGQRRIRGYQKDTSILRIVEKLLLDFGIHSHVEMPNEVVISGRENLRRFKKEINFSPGVRINGNRSNSIWKESLEKRELLDRAIKSFKT